MKQCILYGIGTLLIYTVVGVVTYLSSFDKPIGKGIVRMSGTMLAIGIGGNVCFLTPAIILAIRGDMAFSAVMFAFSVLPVILIVAYINCRVFYDEEGLVYRNFFGRRTAIRYNEITKVGQYADTVIYAGKKKVVIYHTMVGRFDFILTMGPKLDQELLKKTKRSRKVGKVRSLRESVDSYSDFMGAIVVVSLLAIGFLLMMLYAGFQWFLIVISGLAFFMAFLLIHSVRRAHASKFWRAIAIRLYPNVNLPKERHKNGHN